MRNTPSFSRRIFSQTMIAAAISPTLPKRAQAQAQPPLGVADESYMRFVAPELRPAARMMNSALTAMNNMPQKAAGPSFLAGTPLPDVGHRNLRVPVGSGSPDVGIIVINERAGTSRPAILHIHGGGFVQGDAAQSLRSLQTLAKDIDCAIVTVDYRLAPGTTYAGSIEDNYAGLKWLYNHAAEVGADPKRIAVMGESAGGGHAALLAITARDRGEIPILFQCLIYPMLDDRTGSSRRVPASVGKLGWTADSNRFGWRAFLGQEPGTSHVPARAVPARTVDMSGLPPAYIAVGGIDLFVDESIDYAKRLTDAGIAAELLVVPGAFHGFDVFASNTSIARRFGEAKVSALRRAFQTS